MTGKLYVGCPVWACEAWKGQVFTSNAPRNEWLRQYSQAFTTVEGNSTFYALPSLEMAAKWAESVEPDFRFALKVPRSISHDCRLLDCQSDLAEFLRVAEVLHGRGVLGPSFLQLPPDYSPRNLPDLERFLSALPGHLPWAVELRHQAWFDEATNERRLDEVLSGLKIDKVIFDSRPLYSKPASDDVERAAQTRKPKTPVRQTVTAGRPFLRLIGRNNVEEVQPWIEEWAPVIARWLKVGLDPFIFTHAPDDRFAPLLARQLHNEVRKHFAELPPPNTWPAEKQRPAEVQLELF